MTSLSDLIKKDMNEGLVDDLYKSILLTLDAPIRGLLSVDLNISLAISLNTGLLDTGWQYLDERTEGFYK